MMSIQTTINTSIIQLCYPSDDTKESIYVAVILQCCLFPKVTLEIPGALKMFPITGNLLKNPIITGKKSLNDRKETIVSMRHLQARAKDMRTKDDNAPSWLTYPKRLMNPKSSTRMPMMGHLIKMRRMPKKKQIVPRIFCGRAKKNIVF